MVFITRIHWAHVSASIPPSTLKIGKEVMEYFLWRIHWAHVSASISPSTLKIGKEVMEYFLSHFPSTILQQISTNFIICFLR